MSALASGNVTWGISGPAFLAGYLGLAVVVGVGVLLARRRIAAEPATSTASADLERQPHDVAYLNGGPELAVLSALSSMRVAATIVADGRGRVQAAGRLDGTGANAPGELERAIHFAAASVIARHRLPSNQVVRTALENTRNRLTNAGLLLSDDQQRRIKQVGYWMVAVAALGLLRVLAGISNSAPVGFLVVELLAVAVAAAILIARAPWRSPRGTAALARLRLDHTDLAPGMRPDWATYGPAYAGLGVGIFGASALWASDPAFAAEVEAQRVAAASSGGYVDGGGGTSSGGSDSSSGSSCGSGGGCGGGCGGGGG